MGWWTRSNEDDETPHERHLREVAERAERERQAVQRAADRNEAEWRAQQAADLINRRNEAAEHQRRIDDGLRALMAQRLQLEQDAAARADAARKAQNPDQR